jgi:poly(hydroxyalkanoate) depolymerase family esterase
MPLALALLAVVATGVPAYAKPKPRDTGSFTKHTYAATADVGPRDYWVYLPPGTPRGLRPLVVFLHGCNETATEAATATRFNELAARRGFVVVYPEQRLNTESSAPVGDGNGLRCWNWYLDAHQQRGVGEPATIAGITRTVAGSARVDPRFVFVEGISAGANMAVTLGATYPDLYAGVGALAGCAYATCSDTAGSLAHRAMGPRARVVPMFVENGTADDLNNMAMAGTLIDGWLATDDLADDGSANGSVSRVPTVVDTRGTGRTPEPLSGDPCIHNNSHTCPGGVVGFQGSYPYTVTRWDDGGCDVLQLWAIHGMTHAHPNAPAGGPYTDPLGPDVTTASYDFFLRHPLGGRCVAPS